MKSKCTKSVIPSLHNVNTVLLKLDLKISGYVCSCSSDLKVCSVNKRKALPGRVRPARPARCREEALEMGETNSDSTRILGLYTFCFEKPGSITYTIPSIVNDVCVQNQNRRTH